MYNLDKVFSSASEFHLLYHKDGAYLGSYCMRHRKGLRIHSVGSRGETNPVSKVVENTGRPGRTIPGGLSPCNVEAQE